MFNNVLFSRRKLRMHLKATVDDDSETDPKKFDGSSSDPAKHDDAGSNPAKPDDSGSNPAKPDDSGSNPAKTDDSGSDTSNTDSESLKHTFVVQPSSRGFFVVIEIFPYTEGSVYGPVREIHTVPYEISPSSVVTSSEVAVVHPTFSLGWWSDCGSKLFEDNRWVVVDLLKKNILKTIEASNLYSLISSVYNVVNLIAKGNQNLAMVLKVVFTCIGVVLQMAVYNLLKDTEAKKKDAESKKKKADAENKEVDAKKNIKK
ncbi:hypothetical protein QVD17_14929 [Tagetes erecta]|uniref:Uncharacterized protein n=1 Tax=Tagetes erecta TaxID=13708 RepID=A0AAD8NZ68_TARER|nr:hypothetical protein QVD17_14929 [Tagetes erecta]